MPTTSFPPSIIPGITTTVHRWPADGGNPRVVTELLILAMSDLLFFEVNET